MIGKAMLAVLFVFAVPVLLILTAILPRPATESELEKLEKRLEIVKQNQDTIKTNIDSLKQGQKKLFNGQKAIFDEVKKNNHESHFWDNWF